MGKWMVVLALALSAEARESVDGVFRRIYSFDFDRARRESREYAARNPEDPMGPAAVAAAGLFRELHRLGALQGGGLGPKSFREGAALAADPGLRGEFDTAAATAERMAGARLARDGRDREALLTMVVVSGLRRDYAALVDKKMRQSLEHIRASDRYARQLLAVDPEAADAYLNLGFSEYIVGSVPGVLRWAVRVDGVEGNKRRGMEQLARAAVSGRYLKPFAQLLLAGMLKKEGRREESARWLRELVREYPENGVVRQELAKLEGGE
jgi:tetratricopeptide (TPR) repeat protein